MIEQLRSGTRIEHQKLDEFFLPVIRGIHTHSDYVDLLNLLYGYMKPVHDAVDAYLNSGLITDYSLRRRPERLVDDIEALGGTCAPMVLCPGIPGIASVGEAFGAFYVLEGSTHGGPIISRMIKENLRLTDAQGLSFFMGYGANNTKMWESFVRSLEENSTVSDTAMIVESARKTFQCLKNWLIEGYGRKENKTTPRANGT